MKRVSGTLCLKATINSSQYKACKQVRLKVKNVPGVEVCQFACLLAYPLHAAEDRSVWEALGFVAVSRRAHHNLSRLTAIRVEGRSGSGAHAYREFDRGLGALAPVVFASS